MTKRTQENPRESRLAIPAWQIQSPLEPQYSRRRQVRKNSIRKTAEVAAAVSWEQVRTQKLGIPQIMRRRLIQPTREREEPTTKDARAKLSQHNILKEKNRRPEEGAINEEPNSKILRTQGESRGEITKTLLL